MRVLNNIHYYYLILGVANTWVQVFSDINELVI